MKKIKVLQIGAGNLGYGGRSVAIFNLTQHINNPNIVNDFLYFGNKVPVECENKIEGKGGRIIDVGEIPNGKGILYRGWIRNRKIYYAIKKCRYDIVHINADNAYEAMKSVIVSRIAGVKHFVIHGHNTGAAKKFNLCLKIVVRICQVVISKINCKKLACSKEAADYLFGKKYSKDAVIINNGIDVDAYLYNSEIRESVRSEFGLNGKFVVGCVARFSYQKNHMLLLDIFSELKKVRNDAILLLVGDGPLRNEIEDRIKALNLTDSVIVLGNRLDVPRLLQGMDVFVMPSRYEGFGIVAIEAQASGLPCIVSDRVPKAAGVCDLFKRISLEADLKEWIDAILNNTQTRKNMSKEFVNSVFDINSSSVIISDIYYKLVVGRRHED